MNLLRQSVAFLAVVFGMLALTTPALRAVEITDEPTLIANMQSPQPTVVTDALADWAKGWKKGILSSSNSLHAVKELVKDQRPEIRRRAARALGEAHAPVNEADVASICLMLKVEDPWEIQDALKALRGLTAPTAVPVILPILNSSNTHNVRDACRTLAAIGDKTVIPSLEPLLKHRSHDVQLDANKAIAKLREKP